MKKLSTLLIASILFYSCETETKKEPEKLIACIKNCSDFDSIKVYSSGRLYYYFKRREINENRYFLISYSYAFKEFDGFYQGDVWFEADNLPSKNEIDSLVFSGLPLKRSCYQPILINSIYEFKNKEDYFRFTSVYKSQLSTNKKKLECN
jgi:hypothetical protein